MMLVAMVARPLLELLRHTLPDVQVNVLADDLMLTAVGPQPTEVFQEACGCQSVRLVV